MIKQLDPNFLVTSMEQAIQRIMMFETIIICTLIIGAILLTMLGRKGLALAMFFAAIVAIIIGTPWMLILGLIP